VDMNKHFKHKVFFSQVKWYLTWRCRFF